MSLGTGEGRLSRQKEQSVYDRSVSRACSTSASSQSSRAKHAQDWGEERFVQVQQEGAASTEEKPLGWALLGTSVVSQIR